MYRIWWHLLNRSCTPSRRQMMRSPAFYRVTPMPPVAAPKAFPDPDPFDRRADVDQFARWEAELAISAPHLREEK